MLSSIPPATWSILKLQSILNLLIALALPLLVLCNEMNSPNIPLYILHNVIATPFWIEITFLNILFCFVSIAVSFTTNFQFIFKIRFPVTILMMHLLSFSTYFQTTSHLFRGSNKNVNFQIYAKILKRRKILKKIFFVFPHIFKSVFISFVAPIRISNKL